MIRTRRARLLSRNLRVKRGWVDEASLYKVKGFTPKHLPRRLREEYSRNFADTYFKQED